MIFEFFFSYKYILIRYEEIYWIKQFFETMILIHWFEVTLTLFLYFLRDRYWKNIGEKTNNITEYKEVILANKKNKLLAIAVSLTWNFIYLHFYIFFYIIVFLGLPFEYYMNIRYINFKKGWYFETYTGIDLLMVNLNNFFS